MGEIILTMKDIDKQYIITGLIVIAAVYSDVSARRRKN